MWEVRNINGNGTPAVKTFSNYQDAIDYAQWTAGEVVYIPGKTENEH